MKSDHQHMNSATYTATSFSVFKSMRSWLKVLVLSTLMSLGLTAYAQLRVDISGTGAQQYPVAIADFSGDSAGSQISEIIRADLTRTGQFRLISTAASTLTYTTPIAYDEWRTRGADFLAYGTVTRSGDGRLEIKYRLADTVKRGTLDEITIVGNDKELRRMAHQVADRIYEKSPESEVYFRHVSLMYSSAARLTSCKSPMQTVKILKSPYALANPSFRPPGPPMDPAWLT